MSVEKTLEERGARYGDFTDHALIAQEIQDVMRAAPGWGRLTAVQRQALTVIADKQARILSGDPNYTDNWHDIQGYAKLAEDRCQNFDPRQATFDLEAQSHTWHCEQHGAFQAPVPPLPGLSAPCPRCLVEMAK